MLLWLYLTHLLHEPLNCLTRNLPSAVSFYCIIALRACLSLLMKFLLSSLTRAYLACSSVHNTSIVTLVGSFSISYSIWCTSILYSFGNYVITCRIILVSLWLLLRAVVYISIQITIISGSVKKILESFVTDFNLDLMNILFNLT